MLICGCSQNSGEAHAAAVPPPHKSPAEEWADSILGTMSVEERIGQLFMPASFTTADEATTVRLLRYVADAKVGGIVFLKGDTMSMSILSQKLQHHSRVPLFIAIDAEWGLGMRLTDAECFPHNSALGEASPEQMTDYGRRVGRQAHRIGINMVLGPVLDVAAGTSSVMSDRSFGTSPEIVARSGVAYSRGLIDSGIISVGKHFPGHGATSADSHKSLPVIRRDRHTLDSIDIYPFTQYIKAGMPAIMAGHMAVPAIDKTGSPASVSHDILTKLLRERLHFTGLVLTDAMNMTAVNADISLPNEGIYIASLLAGADLILVPENTRQAETEVMDALRNGDIDADLINDRCRRILLYKAIFIKKLSAAQK